MKAALIFGGALIAVATAGLLLRKRPVGFDTNSNVNRLKLKVGERLTITGAPMSTLVGGTDTRGVVISSGSDVLGQDPVQANVWKATKPGLASFAWRAGPWGAGGSVSIEVV